LLLARGKVPSLLRQLGKERCRCAGAADQAADVRRKSEIIPGTPDIEAEIRSVLARLGCWGGCDSMEIKPAVADIHRAAESKLKRRIF
jgi:hypothetical protein